MSVTVVLYINQFQFSVPIFILDTKSNVLENITHCNVNNFDNIIRAINNNFKNIEGFYIITDAPLYSEFYGQRIYDMSNNHSLKVTINTNQGDSYEQVFNDSGRNI